MANVTLRGLPDNVLDQLRTLATMERRSLNSEILVILEASLKRELAPDRTQAPLIGGESQAQLWDNLCGQWRDDRGWKEIADDIIGRRSAGREVAL